MGAPPLPSPRSSAGADEPVWRALADATRRGILDLLRQRPMTTGELADRFEVSRFAVMKHLGVLVEAGLVLVERRGRERWNHLNTVPIREIYRRWIRPFEARRADGLLRLKRQLETRARGRKAPSGVARQAVQATKQGVLR